MTLNAGHGTSRETSVDELETVGGKTCHGRPFIYRTIFPSTGDRDKAKPETQQM
jgi:hypothetical protein